MHNALAVMLSVLFFASSASALYFPQFHLTKSPSLEAKHSEVANKCTFTLSHKQLCTATAKTNYIQINEIEDHSNDLTIDIAALRDIAARNSYSKISTQQVFAIANLLDDNVLVVRGDGADGDNLLFEYDGTLFSSGVGKTNKDAWCVAEAWNNADWECGKGSRVSIG